MIFHGGELPTPGMGLRLVGRRSRADNSRRPRSSSPLTLPDDGIMPSFCFSALDSGDDSGAATFWHRPEDGVDHFPFGDGGRSAPVGPSKFLQTLLKQGPLGIGQIGSIAASGHGDSPVEVYRIFYLTRASDSSRI